MSFEGSVALGHVREAREEKTAGRGTRLRRKRCLAGDLEPDGLATFLESDFPQIGRTATTSTKASRVPQAARSTREASVLGLPPPIPLGRESRTPSTKTRSRCL